MTLSFKSRPVPPASASTLDDLLSVIPFFPPGVTYPPDAPLDTLLQYLPVASPAGGDTNSNNTAQEVQRSVGEVRRLYTLEPCTRKRCRSTAGSTQGSCTHQEPLHSRIPRPLVAAAACSGEWRVKDEEEQVGVVVWSWSSTLPSLDPTATATSTTKDAVHRNGERDTSHAVPIDPGAGAAAGEEWYAARLIFRRSNYSPRLVSHARLDPDEVTGLGLRPREELDKSPNDTEKEMVKGVKRPGEDGREDGGNVARVSLGTLQARSECADESLCAERAMNAELRVRVRDLERERDEAVEAHRNVAEDLKASRLEAARHAKQVGMWQMYMRSLEEQLAKLQAEVEQDRKCADDERG